MENLLAAGLTLLATHGYVVVFVWMFADQAALPLPSISAKHLNRYGVPWGQKAASPTRSLRRFELPALRLQA